MRVLCGLAVLMLAGTVNAQAPTPGKKARTPKVLTFKEMVFPGENQRPEAFYILQRTQLKFKSLQPKKSFIPLILESAEKAPF
jgi:hypothetical protein